MPGKEPLLAAIETHGGVATRGIGHPIAVSTLHQLALLWARRLSEEAPKRSWVWGMPIHKEKSIDATA